MGSLPFGYLQLPVQPRVPPNGSFLRSTFCPIYWVDVQFRSAGRRSYRNTSLINLRPEILLFVLRTSPNLFGWMSLLRVIGTGIILITPVAYGSRPLLEERSGWSGPLGQIGLG